MQTPVHSSFSVRAFIWAAALLCALVGAGALTACGGDAGSGSTASPNSPAADPVQLRLLTHESFVISDEVLDAFTAETGIAVEVLKGKDVGAVVSQIILTRDQPIADVVFGIDNTFLASAKRADVFEPYRSATPVPEEFYAGTEGQVTPIDYGDVCVNYWIEELDELGVPAPTSLVDLTDERYRGLFVTQNPETSSPGLAFLLATIAHFGEDGWEDYWRALRDNEVEVTSDWSEAYNTRFTAGGGANPIVTSYASSPVAEVIFADPPRQAAPTAIIEDSCFRQIEYAGILANSDNLPASRQLIDFMLSETFQRDIPLNMFVFPVAAGVALPEAFVEHAVVPEQPLSLSPTLIADKKNEWTERWVDIVLR